MPKVISFITLGVVIKTKGGKTKFKIRCPRYLYTLKIDDASKAEKIKSSIPSGTKKIDLSQKAKKEERKEQRREGKVKKR